VLDRAKLEHLHLDHPGPGVIYRDRRRPEAADGVLGPPFPELRADLAQLCHQRREPRIAGTLAGRGPELAEHGASGRFPADQAGTVLLIAEHHPQEIAPAGRDRSRIVPEPLVRNVPHDVVEMPVINGGDAGRGCAHG